MPSPFPGMDPYLEGDLWTTVHTDLCAEIARQLAPQLRPKYVALSTRRVVLAPADDSEGSAHFPQPIPHVSFEIRDVAERRLVTCIEVLSPTNKRGPGREEYAGKRLQILGGTAQLVEIDLLRVGLRFPTAQPLPAVPYFVFVSRAGQRQVVEVWPIALQDPLPVVPLPLLPGDPPIPLDLQQALRVVYDTIGYDGLLDYTRPPPGPFAPAEATWVEEQLRQAGRR